MTGPKMSSCAIFMSSWLIHQSEHVSGTDTLQEMYSNFDLWCFVELTDVDEDGRLNVVPFVSGGLATG
jgi:hypothetical protein